MKLSVPLLALLVAAQLGAATFTLGDVFASKSGSVREYNPNGTFVQSLTSGISGFTTGSAFDSSGKLYVTDFSTSQVITFANNAGNTQGTFAGPYSTPEDIRIDSAGNIFVTDLGGHGLREFSSTGTLLNTWDTGARIDWFDLNSSKTIMYYTDESTVIHRWNLTTNTAMTNLCTGCGDFAFTSPGRWNPAGCGGRKRPTRKHHDRRYRAVL